MSTSSIVNKDETALSYLAHQIDAIPAIRDLRARCYDLLTETGMPGPKHEEYRHTPLSRALEKFDFNLKQSPPASIPDIDYALSQSDALSLVFVNGVFDPSRSAIDAVDGLTIKPLAEALGEGVGTDHFGNIAHYSKDAFVAWNTLGWNNGVYIEVKDNVAISRPVILYHLTDARDQQTVTVNRNLIVVGRNAALTVVQKYNSAGLQPQYFNTVTEAFIDDNSRLDHYSLQDSIENQIQFNHLQTHQKNNSMVNSYVFTLRGKLIRNNTALVLDGQGCESHMYGLYLLNGETLADNHTVADHLQPNSFSNELYKGIMDGHSRGVFNGKIYVRPNAQKTNAFQSNRNLLLSSDAKVNTKPQLEIWADDVKCSHGCTTGQLDEEALFYLQTRGIPKATAKAMLLYAFAAELFDVITLPSVKQYLSEIVNDRLQQPN